MRSVATNTTANGCLPKSLRPLRRFAALHRSKFTHSTHATCFCFRRKDCWPGRFILCRRSQKNARADFTWAFLVEGIVSCDGASPRDVGFASSCQMCSRAVARCAESLLDVDGLFQQSAPELGHAAALIRADIREHLNAVWDRLNIRKPAKESNMPDLRRFINRDLELTSRISQSSEITNVLQQLFNTYPGTDERRPVDVCLATNMIQVGLDVPRLGLMTVVGQPKTTSE